MAADKFSSAIRLALKLRAGTICSNPNCLCPTTGPHSDSSKAITVGEAAHITAASPDGPRYDASLSPEKRKSASNGVWLCSKCADLIDKDPDIYSVEVLRSWKTSRESEALARISGCPAPESVDADFLGAFAIIPLPEQYRQQLAQGHKHDPQESLLALEAVDHSNHGRLDQAIDLFAHLSESSSCFDILRVCWAFYYRIAELDYALSLTQRMAGLADSNEKRCIASHARALVLLDIGRPNHATKTFELALEFAKQSSREDLIAQQLTGLGLVHMLTGKADEAQNAFLKSLEICEAAIWGEGAALNYGYLGQLYMQGGRVSEAEDVHCKALAICERSNDQKGQALQLCNLGLIASRNGEADQAETFHRRALAIDEQIGWKKGIASHSFNIGQILFSRGDREAARPFLERAQGLFEELGDYHLAYRAYHSCDAIPLF